MTTAAIATATPLPMPEIACVNPLAYREQLARLFAEDGRADHAEFIERAYPGAVTEGAKAWIGTDPHGRVVMHAGRFAHPFTYGRRRLTGGLIVNIMVARAYRTHHPARALFHRFVADSRADAETDFLYTETTARGANVLRAAGARVIARIVRLVLPVRGTNPAADLAVRAYHAGRRIGTPARDLTCSHHAAGAFPTGPFDAPLGESDDLRGVHGPVLYRRRLKGYPTGLDHWIAVGGSGAAAAALVRGPEPSGLVTIVKLNHPPSLSATGVVLAMLPALREIGCRVVQIYTAAESRFGAELRRAGFVERASQPLVALPISAAGDEVVTRIDRWRIAGLDLDI
jgi:hypothetical protein